MSDITYTLGVTVTRAVMADTADERPAVAEWMRSQQAKTELEREILRALRKIDGDCDAEVMDVTDAERAK